MKCIVPHGLTCQERTDLLGGSEHSEKVYKSVRKHLSVRGHESPPSQQQDGRMGEEDIQTPPPSFIRRELQC
jgi:hypothetical protein